MAGTMGGAAGAFLIGALATTVVRNLPALPLFFAVVGAGISGMVLDSLLGATVEGRVRWINNSLVNLLATAWGAGLLVAVFR